MLALQYTENYTCLGTSDSGILIGQYIEIICLHINDSKYNVFPPVLTDHLVNVTPYPQCHTECQNEHNIIGEGLTSSNISDSILDLQQLTAHSSATQQQSHDMSNY